jgi:DNA-binding NarL/FixJ family response regulator
MEIDNIKTVVRISITAKEKYFHFEDIADKLNFRPCRMNNLRELLSYLTSVLTPPVLITIAEDVADLHRKCSSECLLTLSEIVSAIKVVLISRFDENTPKIAILVNKPVSKKVIKCYRDAGAHGIIPKVVGFPLHVTLKAYEELLNKGESWPLDAIERATPRQSKKQSTDESGMELTERQTQVRKLLCEMGLSNKAIARQLNISESTVKIHVGTILKRYGVRNRTQLALAANNRSRL